MRKIIFALFTSSILASASIFIILIDELGIKMNDNDIQITDPKIFLQKIKDDNGMINGVGFSDHKTVTLIPYLTAKAYEIPGFYQYFASQCDESCLSVQLDKDVQFGFTSSLIGINMFNALGSEVINDLMFADYPTVIHNYDTVFVLHNEYVTQDMYDELQKHQQVFYLYPNALYGEVEIVNNTMTLIRGHNYPEQNILNGFDWKWENTHPWEYDTICEEPEWRETHNGFQLMCYPEIAFMNHPEIIEFIHDNLIN